MTPKHQLTDLHENILLQIEEADVNREDMKAHKLRNIATISMAALEKEASDDELIETLCTTRRKLQLIIATYV